jgi:hypothetical protein
MGTRGYYDTLRVTERSDQYSASPAGSPNFVYTGTQNRATFTYTGAYNGVTIDNETGWPNYQFINETAYGEEWKPYTTKYEDTAVLRTASTFANAKLTQQKQENLQDSTTTTTDYAYHATFKNSPREIKTQVVKGADSSLFYRVLDYNTWGGLKAETVPIDEATRNNQSLREKYETEYGYNETYHIQTSKTWRQDPNGAPGGEQLTETAVVDSLGTRNERRQRGGRKNDF